MAKETKKSDFRVTKALQETVRKNPLIKEVYFDEDGGHFFVKHKINLVKTNEYNQVVETKEVECLPGAKNGIVQIKHTLNGIPTWRPARKIIECTPIAAAFSRDEILKATPVADLRSEKEKLEILQAAAEISKEADFDSLLQKLKK